jgi:hypothetical protein
MLGTSELHDVRPLDFRAHLYESELLSQGILL